MSKTNAIFTPSFPLAFTVDL